MARDKAILEAAVAWAVRTADPAFDDWDAFTAWLEAHPSHAQAYDEVAAAAADSAEALAAMPRPDNDDEIAAPKRRRFLAGAVAILALVAGFGTWQQWGGAPRVVETAPGQVQVIEVASGGEIAVSGGSRLLLDSDDPRQASLEYGRALFTLDHDAGAPFRLKVGDDTLVDVGTVFDVTLTPDAMTVAVSEGAVVFNPGSAAARVEPGQVLTHAVDAPGYRIDPIPLAEIGEWRQGRLTFRDATLKQLAGDLSRATGTRFIASPGAAGRRVSGSLRLDGVASDPRTLGPLLGVTVRNQAGAWELGSL